jgi:hypothetical protein
MNMRKNYFFILLIIGMLSEARSKMDDAVSIDVNTLILKADAIAIATASTVQSPGKNDNRKYYQISSFQNLKGGPFSDVIVRTEVSADAPVLEPNMRYMVFLSKSRDAVPTMDSSALYEFVDAWKGVIPLAEGSSETRSINAINKNFGVDIRKKAAGFVKAVGFTLKGNNYEVVKQALHLHSIIGPKFTPFIGKAQFVTVAKATKVEAPYEVLGRWFYMLAPEEVIKGAIDKKHYLEIIYNRDTRWGNEPDPEGGIPFVLFLNPNNPEDAAPRDFTYYSLVDHWKGIIALNEKSKEQRSSNEILSLLGINVAAMSGSFVKSLQLCADTAQFQEANDAVFVYRALHLKRSEH